MDRQKPRRSTNAGLLIVALLACGHDAPNSPAPARQMVAIGRTTSTGVVGTAVAAPAVRVLDARNRPIAGVSVRFDVTEGFGSVANVSATTDVDGMATAGMWTLDTKARLNLVRATSDNAQSVWFSARGRAGSPATLQADIGNDQVGLVSQTVNSPVVRVRDAYGNGVSDVAVTFVGLNALNPLQAYPVTTNALGLAVPPSWELPSIPGTYSVTASVPGLPAVVFRAKALDAKANVAIYDLITIADQPPRTFYVDGSIIYLANTGEFIEDTQWHLASSQHISGRYTFLDPLLTIEYEGEAETGTIASDALFLRREDPDFGTPVIWFYSKRR